MAMGVAEIGVWAVSLEEVNAWATGVVEWTSGVIVRSASDTTTNFICYENAVMLQRVKASHCFTSRSEVEAP